MHVNRLLEQLGPALPEQLVGLYLCGSAARGTAGPHSDIDLLAVTRRSLDPAQREGLTTALLEVSGWSGHRKSFPEAADRRPVEFSVIVRDHRDRRDSAPQVDFQYGEWLRAEVTAGELPQPFEHPDVLLLLEDARQNHRTLFGPDLQEFLAAPPPALLARACRDALPALVEELHTDTRNTLLTLARMVVTVTTGQIVSKHRAAVMAAGELPQAEGALLLRAAEEHRGETSVDWGQEQVPAQRAADRLASRIRGAPAFFA